MSASIMVILDKRRMKKKSGKFPVKLQVTHQRIQQRYQTTLEISDEDYKKIYSSNIGANLKKIRQELELIKRNAENFVSEMNSFSFYVFERDFINRDKFYKPKKLITPEAEVPLPDAFDYGPYLKRFTVLSEDHSRHGCISFVFANYIKVLLQEGRIGTAIYYKDSYNSFKKFMGNVLFSDITQSWLNQYEQWMKKRGRTRTTTGIKLRALRTMFNEAIEMNIIKRENCYPFGRRKYQIPTGRNIKKALPQKTISDIYYAETTCDHEQKAKDFWFFCYFGNGMNPKDMLYLKYKNIEDEFIVFVRAKTERTTRNDPKPISAYITDDMKQIMERWGNPDKKPDSYIFPIMDDTLNPLDQYKIVTGVTRLINDWMEKIGERLGLDKKITTIVSRHSFSTHMKQGGASTEFIQEALGHTDKKTTENYLDSFTSEVKKEYAAVLTAFKKDVALS